MMDVFNVLRTIALQVNISWVNLVEGPIRDVLAALITVVKKINFIPLGFVKYKTPQLMDAQHVLRTIVQTVNITSHLIVVKQRMGVKIVPQTIVLQMKVSPYLIAEEKIMDV